MNQVNLVGYLGSDAEVKQTAQGNALTTFQIATNERYKSKDGGYKEKTHWHSVVLWGNESFGKILKKGQMVEVVGSISYGSYEKTVGTEKVIIPTVEIRAQKVSLVGAYLGPKRTDETNEAEGTGPIEP